MLGGGFAGISIAHKFDPDAWPDLEVTVFERESYIGGRARTIMSYDNYLNEGQPVMTGGGTFDSDDRIIMDHGREVGVNVHETFDEEDELSSPISAWNEKLEEMQLNGLEIRYSPNQ